MSGVLLCCFLPYFLRQSLSLNLEYIPLARLAGSKLLAPTCLTSSDSCYPALFYAGAGDPYSVLMFAQQTVHLLSNLSSAQLSNLEDQFIYFNSLKHETVFLSVKFSTGVIMLALKAFWILEHTECVGGNKSNLKDLKINSVIRNSQKWPGRFENKQYPEIKNKS